MKVSRNGGFDQLTGRIPSIVEPITPMPIDNGSLPASSFLSSAWIDLQDANGYVPEYVSVLVLLASVFSHGVDIYWGETAADNGFEIIITASTATQDAKDVKVKARYMRVVLTNGTASIQNGVYVRCNKFYRG